MRSKDESKFKIIANEIKRFVITKGRPPTQRELSESPEVGLGRNAVCNYLKTMRGKGLVVGVGREISTEATQLTPMPILDSLFDCKHGYEEAKIDDFILLSRRLYGEGEFGLVRVIDDSMSNANINKNNFLIIRRQRSAETGQVVLVRTSERYYLRRLIFDAEKKGLRVTSESLSIYEEIPQYEIRGVVVSVISHLDKSIVERYIQYLKN